MNLKEKLTKMSEGTAPLTYDEVTKDLERRALLGNYCSYFALMDLDEDIIGKLKSEDLQICEIINPAGKTVYKVSWN